MQEHVPQKENRRILRLKEVRQRTGLSTAWLYELMRKDLLPKNFKIIPNGRASGWFSDEIEAWVASRRNFQGE